MSTYYGFEYFCGSNIVVEILGVPILEVTGISYSENESKIPLYGYSSRFFDAVARGQDLVRGDIIVNYVHTDYLYQAIEMGIEQIEAGLVAAGGRLSISNPAFTGRYSPSYAASDLTRTERGADAAIKAITERAGTDVDQALRDLQALKTRWLLNQDFGAVQSQTLNPHDYASPMQIKVTFGNRTAQNKHGGKFGVLLTGVYFLGRGTRIDLGSDIIVESYPFFARRIFSLRPEALVSQISKTETGETQIETGSDTLRSHTESTTRNIAQPAAALYTQATAPFAGSGKK